MTSAELAETAVYVSRHSRPQTAEVWGYGLIAVTILQLCAAESILILKCISKNIYEKILLYFVGLGIGATSGAALFHLLRESFAVEPNEESQNRTASDTKESAGDGVETVHLSCLIVAGIFLFFLSENIAKIFSKYRKLRRNVRTNDNNQVILTSFESASTLPVDKSVSSEPQRNVKQKIKAVAYMIICGDGFDKFVDGLTVGSTFAIDISTGVSVALAILLEEFPHKLGDVAILRASGMSNCQALGYNAVASLFCYAGFVAGVFAGEQPLAQKGILAVATGMFLFIALSTMLPQVRSNVENALQEQKVKKAVFILSLQTFGIITGLLAMFLTAFYEEPFKFLINGH